MSLLVCVTIKPNVVLMIFADRLSSKIFKATSREYRNTHISHKWHSDSKALIENVLFAHIKMQFASMRHYNLSVH